MVELTKLSNGITVVTERSMQYKTVSFGVYVRTGSAYETVKNKGISHLIEHMLFKGTTTRSTVDIAEEIVKLGDDVNAYTSKEFTAFYGTTLSEYLERIIMLLADMLQNSLIDEADLEREKHIVAEEITMYEDSPEDLVGEKLQEAVWKNPLGFVISGDIETVMSLSRDDLLEYIKEHYTAENMIISVAGAFDENIVDVLEKAFGSVNLGPSSACSLMDPGYEKSFVKIKKNIDQVHMNIAFPCIASDSEEQYTMAVFQSAFGGSNNSMLFQRIREELGLAYSVYSYSNTYQKAGLLQIDATIGAKSIEKTIEEIHILIDNVKKNGIPTEQFENFKNQVIIELIMGNESPSDKMAYNARQLLAYDKLIPQEEQIKKIKAVTEKDVVTFANKYLDLSLASYSFVGKFSRVKSEKIKMLYFNR